MYGLVIVKSTELIRHFKWEDVTFSFIWAPRGGCCPEATQLPCADRHGSLPFWVMQSYYLELQLLHTHSLNFLLFLGLIFLQTYSCPWERAQPKPFVGEDFRCDGKKEEPHGNCWIMKIFWPLTQSDQCIRQPQGGTMRIYIDERQPKSNKDYLIKWLYSLASFPWK